MNSGTQGRNRGGSVWQAASGVRRGWWVGVLVAALVALGAGVQYVRAVHAAPYVASQTLHIALLQPQTASTSAVTAADANAASIARLLTSGGLLASPRLDAAIAARMHEEEPTFASVSPGAVAAGLSATHDAGGSVSLRARWPSARGAEALLRATVEVLRGGALASEPAVTALAQSGLPGAVLRVDAAGAPSSAAPDVGTLAAARGDLLARIGLSVLAGLLAALAGGMLLARRAPAAARSERGLKA